jgi:putative transposase
MRLSLAKPFLKPPESKGYPPRIEPMRATLFVTLRLIGRWPRAAPAQVGNLRQFLDLVEQLDQADGGAEWLRDERLATLVSEGLLYRDGRVFHLDAYCIMPTHVHVIFAPYPGAARVGGEDSFASILHSLKRQTAMEANRILGRQGNFWEGESFGRYLRDQLEWERIVDHVLNNPVRAGLARDWREWRWSFCRYEWP